MTYKICIMGAGNGGFAAAADLTLRGFTINLYEDPRFKQNIEKLKDDKINVTGVGSEGTAKVNMVTTDLAKALDGVDIIMPISPAFAQEDVAKSLVPHISEGMIICLTPGSCGGALVYGKIFKDNGVFDKVKLCEMQTLPYATRKVNDDTVKILLETKKMYFAAFPSKNNQELYDIVKKIYPNIELVNDVLETSLNNGNITSHPAPVVLNAGKIEYYGKHFHYKEGITPSVANVNWDVDKERMAICKAFGYKEVNAMERLYLTGYARENTETLYESYQTSEDIFLPIEGPNDLNGRYLTEDAPYSLVFCANLAKAVGVETPIMNSVANLACSLKQENYWQTGRTLKDVGLDGKDINEMKEFLREGY